MVTRLARSMVAVRSVAGGMVVAAVMGTVDPAMADFGHNTDACRESSGPVVTLGYSDLLMRDCVALRPSAGEHGVRLAFLGDEAVPWAVPSLLGGTSEQLAAEAIARHEQIETGTRDGASREAWEIWLIVNQIVRDFPRSREAYLLRRNMFSAIDLAQIEEAANLWLTSNPEAAKLYEFSSGQIDPSVDVLTAGGRSDSDIVTNSAPPIISQPTVPSSSWFQLPATEIGSDGSTQSRDVATARKPSETMSSGQAEPKQDLYGYLKTTTVIVLQLAVRSNGSLYVSSSGTGSFIAPDLVLTNTHVVEDSPGVPAKYFLVANKALGISRATLLARGQARSPNPQVEKIGVDAALLRVEDVKSESFLEFATDYTEGEMIVLSGFASRANENDKAYNDLLGLVNAGVIPTSDSIPSPKFSSGRIQAVFTDVRGEETVSADISVTFGASGSALADPCGRMVALLWGGTTAYVEKNNYVDTSRYNYSASAREVMKWLDSARVRYSVSSASCPGQ